MSQQPTAKYRDDYRAPDFTITDINLEFDLNPNNTLVTAVSQVKSLNDNATDLVLDGDALTLVRLDINGDPWTAYSEEAGKLIIRDVPAAFTLTVQTQLDPENNTALEGLYISGGAYCTQCEAEGFRRITYYLDRPDVLARFTTKVIADKANYPYLLSNGNKIASGELEGGRHWVEWHDPYAKPSYLFALVGGDFDVLRDSFVTRSGRDVALEIFVDKGNLDRADHAMTSLKNAMKWDEDRFDLEYDLDIYMIVAVDFFNMGAMENKGLNIFNSKYVLANSETATDTDYLGIEAVIGHEYFHNWTGNRVTCRDWFQLSLKEGLTVFRDQEFSSDLGSRSVNRINNARIMRGPQFAEDASPMSHPIRPEKVIEMNNFYTLTVYEKGSEVIRMMHTILGEAGFQKGVKLYFDRHDGTAATCDDFVQAMEDASGIDLTQFRRWYSQSGTPVLSVSSTYDPDSKQLALHVSQHTPPTADQQEKLPLYIPLDIELYRRDGSVIKLQRHGESVSNVLAVTETEQTFIFDEVDQQPVLSLLREFSAPVKLDHDYQDEELAFLLQHAQNDFARWDAGQSLLAKHIKANVARVQNEQPIDVPLSVIDAFRGVLLSDNTDPALIAEVLNLPSETEVAGWFDTVDVDAIHQVMAAFKQQFADHMVDEFDAVYRQYAQPEYQITHKAIGERALRNACLSYLAHSENGNTQVERHYQDANNMTDTMAALNAANTAQLPCREPLMKDFSDKWQHDGLVMDKWFMLQGANPADNALDQVRAQMDHPAFTLKNPNRVRSLVGAFCNRNPARFHAKDGSGYRFLKEILVILNQSNPQVASRLIDPMLKLAYFDQDRQAKMRQVLQELADMDNLAADLYEKVEKTLEQ
ncbi:aminopeptidase N [Salinivibrio kushneri]|uniref:Aminopeptidase N n=1 Tax=Salinivibrio kushneri TaxID=1908198 RepID=A0AA47KNF3_9GAMM|nr:aminopeptidase N [Salinivibrio kushneri]WBA09852.1 aminopeptidase N [Salinivibrio kushneri]